MRIQISILQSYVNTANPDIGYITGYRLYCLPTALNMKKIYNMSCSFLFSFFIFHFSVHSNIVKPSADIFIFVFIFLFIQTQLSRRQTKLSRRQTLFVFIFIWYFVYFFCQFVPDSYTVMCFHII